MESTSIVSSMSKGKVDWASRIRRKSVLTGLSAGGRSSGLRAALPEQ